MDKYTLNPRIREENAKQFIIMCENFKFLRQAKGWSVGELSEISGINEKILAGMQEGRDFEVRYLIQLCDVYHIKPHEIFSRCAPC